MDGMIDKVKQAIKETEVTMKRLKFEYDQMKAIRDDLGKELKKIKRAKV